MTEDEIREILSDIAEVTFDEPPALVAAALAEVLRRLPVALAAVSEGRA